jgi:hypothetical protein
MQKQHVGTYTTVVHCGNKSTIMAEYGIRGKTHTARCICDWNILDKCALLTSYERSVEPQ